MRIQITINDHAQTLEVEPRERLSGLLRERLRLTGVKEGCLEGECGACTVLLDGKPVNACLMLAFQADGHSVTTIEGLGDGALTTLQHAFVEHGAIQCGFCTPGMVLAAEGLLRATPDPDPQQVRRAVAGNLCRCTGFANIVRAVRATATARLAAHEAR